MIVPPLSVLPEASERVFWWLWYVVAAGVSIVVALIVVALLWVEGRDILNRPHRNCSSPLLASPDSL